MTSSSTLRPISEISVKRILLGSFALLTLAACKPKETPPLQIPVDVARRRDIAVTAEATGRIEPINVVDIKSKAGGQIIYMPVETGTQVQPGDTIVALDKRDVEAAYMQSEANLNAAKARLANAIRLQEQNAQLFEAGFISKRDKDNSDLDVTNQRTNLISAEQALELARQRLEDATIVAPSVGTILDKLVSQGTVIASASNSASGGTTLVRMADLSRVRARVLVSETDIGKVDPGLPATILVDAFPNRPFEGVVEKIEPQAVVDQNVTMFPVSVSLPNEEGALKPGMNGEVSISVERKTQVLSIPLDAFRLANEASTVAEMFGVTREAVDSVARVGQSRARTQQFQISDEAGSEVPVGRGGPPAGGQGGNGRQGAGGQGGQGGTGAQGGGRGMPQVTGEQCSAVTAAISRVQGLQQQLESINTRQMQPDADRAALGNERRELLEKAGIETPVYTACRMREMQAQNPGAGRGEGNTGRGGANAGRGGRGGRGGGAGGRGGNGAPGVGNLGQRNMGLGVRGQGLAQQGIVFVQIGVDTTAKPAKPIFEPRFVRLGSQNYDYAEVTEGLQEGEVVALLAAARIEVARRQAAERQKANTSLIPGMGGGAGRGGPGGMGGMGGPGMGGGPGGGGGGGGGGRGGGRGN